MQMSSSIRCDKCGANSDNLPCSMLNTYNENYSIGKRYPICEKCFKEWICNGYDSMWYILYSDTSCELANKMVLDFLGKLGESDEINKI